MLMMILKSTHSRAICSLNFHTLNAFQIYLNDTQKKTKQNKIKLSKDGFNGWLQSRLCTICILLVVPEQCRCGWFGWNDDAADEAVSTTILCVTFTDWKVLWMKRERFSLAKREATKERKKNSLKFYWALGDVFRSMMSNEGRNERIFLWSIKQTLSIFHAGYSNPLAT